MMARTRQPLTSAAYIPNVLSNSAMGNQTCARQRDPFWPEAGNFSPNFQVHTAQAVISEVSCTMREPSGMLATSWDDGTWPFEWRGPRNRFLASAGDEAEPVADKESETMVAPYAMKTARSTARGDGIRETLAFEE